MKTSMSHMLAQVPAAIVSVCETLRAAGHEGWIVGGAVRDLVLGKTPSDWDVASDALPDRVLALFDKTIATGLQHGTVTAMVGRGAAREAVEITTFRGEGAYSDSRRPDEVFFGVPLDEDLKRRDFVINAMALDPVGQRLHDPFGGVADLASGVVRAVGNASERFNEDGLRVLRALRFVSQLDFQLDVDTEAGIDTALEALSKVAWERVRVEILKLLSGRAPTRALQVAKSRGVLALVLPERCELDVASVGAHIEALESDAVLRLAALCIGLETTKLDELLRRLTMSNEDRQRIVAALQRYQEFPAAGADVVSLRRHLSAVGRVASRDQVRLWGAHARAFADDALAATCARASTLVDDSDVPLEVRDLAIKGGELIAATGLRGPRVGETLRELLDWVIEDPARNQREALLSRARAS